MPTTSNFGWTTPADTDLVKDGAAAIRTLGNGIDTSLLDLKGGTTGQILSKTSNSDLDYTWVTPNVGDITEVQAGTGISVASGTGPIPVITNTVATAFDAAGDLVYGTGADTFTKLGIGTAGQVLKVNSGATAPEWGAAGSSFVGCSVYTNANVNIANSTATKVAWNAEYYDTNSMHDNSSNNTRITIPSGQGGKYLITTQILLENNATGERNVRITKNNTDWGYLNITGVNSGSSYYCISGTEVLDLAAADYIEIKVSQNSGGNLALIENSRLQVSKIG